MSLAEYKRIGQELKELRSKQNEIARLAFKEGANLLFEKFPKMDSFTWKQYTCYWNDGEPTYFSVNNDTYSLGINAYEPLDYDERSEEEMQEDDLTYEERKVILKEVSDFLEVFETNTYLELFGDHVQITVQRTGDIEIEDYSSHN